VRSKDQDDNPKQDNKVTQLIESLDLATKEKLIILDATVTSLDTRVCKMDERISSQLQAIDHSLDDKIRAIDNSLDKRLQTMEDRFARVEGILERLLAAQLNSK